MAPAPSTPTGFSSRAPGVGWLPLLEKRANALDEIRGAASLALHLLFECHLGLQVVRPRRIQRLLGQGKRARRHRRQLLRQRDCCVEQDGSRHDVVNHAPLQRFLGGDFFAQKHQRRCTCVTDQAWQEERASRVGDEANLVEALNEGGVFGSYHDVAGQCEVGARARGHTVDRRYDRLLELPNRANHRRVARAHHVTEIDGPGLGRRRFAEVLPRAKPATVAGEEDRTNGAVTSGHGKRPLDLLGHPPIEAVEDVRSTERDSGNALVDAVPDEVVIHTESGEWMVGSGKI
jgi:hypothetical protein